MRWIRHLSGSNTTLLQQAQISAALISQSKSNIWGVLLSKQDTDWFTLITIQSVQFQLSNHTLDSISTVHHSNSITFSFQPILIRTLKTLPIAARNFRIRETRVTLGFCESKTKRIEFFWRYYLVPCKLWISNFFISSFYNFFLGQLMDKHLYIFTLLVAQSKLTPRSVSLHRIITT